MDKNELLRRPFGVLLVASLLWGASVTPSAQFMRKTENNNALLIMQKTVHKKRPSITLTLPGGHRTIVSHYRFVALYGAPDDPALGVLGEQSVDEAVVRAKNAARQYQQFSEERVLPTFEIISTVASAEPTDNNDYSREIDMKKLELWVKKARIAGVYVLLDLQSGRSDFLSQAKPLKKILEQPHVGLALDPEWRLKPNEVPLEQIGSVHAHEINEVSEWLAKLTASNKLPQKLFLLHQFRLDMIEHRDLLNTTHKELAYVIQMDGNGDQQVKQDTWSYITQDAPANVAFGWKNFYDEDSPTLTPKQTMQKLPAPWYVSYQ